MSLLVVGGHLGGIADQVFTRMRPIADALIALAATGPAPSAADDVHRDVVIVPRELTRC